MDIIMSMFPTIGCIAIICFLAGETFKCLPIPTKIVPVLVAILGGILGVIGQRVGISDLSNVTVLDAIATGICSGLVASGAYSLIKNVSGEYPENNLPKNQQEK